MADATTRAISSRPNRSHSFALALLATLLLTAFAPLEAAADPRYFDDGSVGTSHPDWMSWLPDSVRVSELSLPGTHHSMSDDAATWEVWVHRQDWMKAQEGGVASQLASGIRVLDIQLRHRNDQLVVLYMGLSRQDVLEFAVEVSLEDPLQIINDFLAANESETVFVVGDIRDGGSNTRTHQETFDWVRDQSGLGSRIWQPPCDGSASNPTIGEIRGKIVFLSPSLDTCRGIPWPTGTVEDDEVVGANAEIDEKWSRVRANLNAADDGDPNDLYITLLGGVHAGEGFFLLCNNPIGGGFICTLSGSIAHPYRIAGGTIEPLGLVGLEVFHRGVNDYALEFLLDKTTRRTGIVLMDFPGAALIDAIIALNFRFATDVSQLAPDFNLMVNNIAYSGSELDGDRAALDRLRLAKNFANFVLPRASGDFVFAEGFTVSDGNISLGWSVIPQSGLYRETDWIDTDGILGFTEYRTVLFGAVPGYYGLDPAVRAALPAFVDARCGSLSVSQADTLRTDLETQFPGVFWNVLIKDDDGGFVNWASSTFSWSDRYDTGGAGKRCVVWGYPPYTPLPPPNSPPSFTTASPLVPFALDIYEITAQDPDGDPIVIEADQALPSWLTLGTTSGGGTAYLVGTAPEPGNYEIELQVSDGVWPAVSERFVLKSNGPPAFVTDPNLVPRDRIGAEMIWDVYTEDVNDDDVAISVQSLPSWLFFQDDGDGSATLFALLPEIGTHQVRLYVDDGVAPQVSRLFTLEVTGNSPPTVLSTSPIPPRAGTSNVWDFLADDADGDPLTIEGRDLPVGAILQDNGDGTASITTPMPPATDQTVSVEVSDGVSSRIVQLVSLPEPGLLVGLLTGGTVLVGLDRRRRRRSMPGEQRGTRVAWRRPSSRARMA